jgi:hypothetical protein
LILNFLLQFLILKTITNNSNSNKNSKENLIVTKSDTDTIKDYMDMFKTALGEDPDEIRRQKYLQLAQFGANLLAQPGGDLAAAVGKAAEPSLAGLAKIQERKQDVATKAKLLGVEAALKKMDPTQLEETVDFLMKSIPGLTRKEAINMTISGGATKGQTRESRRQKLAETIEGEAIAPREADIISEKIVTSEVPSYKYTLLPENPVVGNYYYTKDGTVGKYEIKNGQPGLVEQD